MSIIALPKYQIVPGEDPDVTAERLHRKKNTPVVPYDIDFPPYRFRPYPTCVYRHWEPEAREREMMRLAAKQMLDLSKRNDLLTAEHLVGEYESRLVGVTDFIAHEGGEDEVISALRERNEKEHQALLDEGWADRPDQVKAAAARLRMQVATVAAERQFEDRRLSPNAAAELERIDDASEDHVIDLPKTRKDLKDKGLLKEPK